MEGKVLLPQGSVVEGHLETVHARRMLRPGALHLVFDRIKLPDGTTRRAELVVVGRHRVDLVGRDAACRQLPERIDVVGAQRQLLAAGIVYFHLCTIRPQARVRYRLTCVGLALLGSGLVLATNLQRTGRLSDELYMSVLMPPRLRARACAA